ncbi:unnamed protein product [Heligmosomoides polygyrus]|uniref:HTH_48 domain-containing protein n=1 Tax=Heligmosomoides polygyrus TaxID=6339 RepID=A0A183F374_HELPZ|nr:unnamed protein product [Heligmosomoides polygyrus]
MSTKYGAMDVPRNAQDSIVSKSFVSTTPASNTNHMAAVDNDPLKASVEADARKTTRDIAEDLDVDHTMVVRHLKQIERTKKLNSESQEKVALRYWGPSFAQRQRIMTLERIMTCDEKWILDDNRRCLACDLTKEKFPDIIQSQKF